MTRPADTMNRIAAAVELGRSGRKVQARDALTALWDEIADDGEVSHRCALAHYLADLQDSPEEELVWDERALAAATGHAEARAFLPSLHLNLADVHRRLTNIAEARGHLALARGLTHHLPEDQYGDLIRDGIHQVSQALEAGSTLPLDRG